MDGFFLVVVLCLLLTLLVLQWRWRRRHLINMAERIPGPPTWPVIGNALQIGRTATALHEEMKRYAEIYSPIMRFWLGPFLIVGLMDPKDIEIVLSNPKYNVKAVPYNLLHVWLGRGLLTSYGERWFKHRKLITPSFHFKILEDFLVPINRKSSILAKKLEKEIDGPSFDIYSYISLYTLDAITETAMGLDVNAQIDEKSSYVVAVKLMGDIMMRRILQPWYYSNTLFNMSADGRKQKMALKVLHGTTRTMIQTKQKELEAKSTDAGGKNAEEKIGCKKRLAFLDLLLSENKTNETFTIKHVQEEVDTFMFEGHDTTASCLGFTLWLLSRNHEVQDKVYTELEAVLSDCSDSTPTIQTLNEMKYLDCVVRESMRLYPPVPIIAREIKEDVKLSGNYTLPAGTNILLPMMLIHRNPAIFSDYDTFYPERFLHETKLVQNPFAYIPFSAGPRNCIGQKFAMLSMKVTLSKILSHYNLLPDFESEPILSPELTLKSVNGLRIKITRR